MPYDPKNPSSLFDEENFINFVQGINNAYKLRAGLGGDPDREDVGVCMAALSDAEKDLERAACID